MTFTHTHDIIISGGGMVGLALAVAAAKAGIRVALVEKHLPTSPITDAGTFSPRVSALNHASERLLTHLGAWQRIPSVRKSVYSNMFVWDGLGQGSIEFDSQSVQQPHLGHIVENSFITDALWSCVYELSNIEVFTNDSVEHWQSFSDRVEAKTKQGELLIAELIVGAEGKHSPVRAQSNIDTWQWDYNHQAIVTTVRHEFAHQQTAQQVFHEKGPLAFLPLASETGEHFSSIVWSVSPNDAEEILASTDEQFIDMLGASFEHRLGDILSVDPRQSFPLTAQQAKKYIDSRMALIGDAAHTIHPLAGLGVNLGFLDAAALAESLTNARKSNLDIGHEFVLRRYQRNRQSHNLAVAGIMEGLKRIFDTQAPLPVIARNFGLNLLNSRSLVKRPLILGAMGDFGVPLPELCKPPQN
jgi:2-octaprenylphenol hydroxylase